MEAEKSKTMGLIDFVFGESPHFLTDSHLLTITSHVRRHKGTFLGLFYKVSYPIHEDSIFMI